MCGVRESVKLVLLNNNDELLLLFTEDVGIRSSDGSETRGGFFQLVGGKIEDGESVLDAAKRELFEETGLSSGEVVFGPTIWYGVLELELHGVLTKINQRFLLARTRSTDVTLKNLTSDEKGTCKRLEWMSLEKIKKSSVVVYPKKLPIYLEPVLCGEIPDVPVEIDLS